MDLRHKLPVHIPVLLVHKAIKDSDLVLDTDSESCSFSGLEHWT